MGSTHFLTKTLEHVSTEMSLHGSSSHDHLLGLTIESALHRIEHSLMLPASHAPLFARRALCLHGALRAHVGQYTRMFIPSSKLV